MTPFDEFWAAYPRREKKQAARGTCGRRAHRWPEGDWRREKAEKLWRSYDAAMLEHAPTVGDVL